MGCSSSTITINANGNRPELLEDPCLDVDFETDFFDHYCLDAKIGQGGFAQVRLITSLPPGLLASDEEVKTLLPAMLRNKERKTKCTKVIDLRDRRRPGKECPALRALAAMEVRIAQKVGDHPNVVKFFGAYKHDDLALLVMEKCDRSLFEYMRELPDINEKSLGKLVTQMLSSLHHLHSLRVVHRDVKPDNFLLGGPTGHTVKLCDFGLAAALPDHGMLCGLVGTTPFMCPEMLAGFWYDTSADIWSLAVIVYVFLFGSFPYVSKDDTEEGMMKAIVKGRAPTFAPVDKKKRPPSFNACKFARAMLQRSGDLRPSAGEALNFPYMVMVMTGRHMKNVAVPSLRPEFELAREIGAFSSNRLSEKTSLDDVLYNMQFRKTGIKMPQAWQVATALGEKGDDKRWNKVFPENGIDALSTISEGSTNCANSPVGSLTQLSPNASFAMSSLSRSSSKESSLKCSTRLSL